MKIVVHGAGIFGLSIAWTCLKRGADVTVADPHGPATGASGGIVGALAPHVPEAWNDKKALQFESLDRAEAFWRDVQDAAGSDPGYARLGRLQPLPDTRAVELARMRAASAAALWQGRYKWEVIAAADAPLALPSPTGLVAHDTLTARVHPRRATLALAQALAAKGVAITASAPSGGVHIHATGVSGLMDLNALSDRRVIGTGVKGQAALLACDLRAMPQVFAEGLHIVPHADGTTAVGSTTERDYSDARSTDARLDAVLDKARRVVPALANAAVIERWAGLRPRAHSRAPMIGRHPAIPGAYIANGGFKIGFGMAPIVAALVADLVLEGRDGIPPLFRPEASLGRMPKPD